MFVMTAKLSKPRLIAAGVLILAVVILVVALVSGGGGGSADAPDGATNDARLAYLAGFGWSVNGTPKQTQQVRIPKSADDRVFSRYNALQKSQGFDLTAHAGKEATRYEMCIRDRSIFGKIMLVSYYFFRQNAIGFRHFISNHRYFFMEVSDFFVKLSSFSSHISNFLYKFFKLGFVKYHSF